MAPKEASEYLWEKTDATSTDRIVILLVEPDAIFRRLLVRCLGKEGHLIYEASNARDAIAHSEWKSGSIDLLIADLAAARSRDYELIRSLIADAPRCRVLLVLGYLEDNTMPIPEFAAERIAVINKPFGPTALTEKVREILALDGD